MGPNEVFRAGPGITITTAGSTSSRPPTPFARQTSSRGLLGRAPRQYASWLFPQSERQGLREQDPASRPRHGLPRPWEATTATSIMTAFWTCTWVPVSPASRTLIPNRMFKNMSGERFTEITGIAGTGHLQKGHGVACGDWDNDGDIDIFIQLGGAAKGDAYHNVLFQNPGQGNNWLTVKLVGKKTNRPAIGARIKVITAGEKPLTVHRHVSSGSSFGANPLRQTIGLAKASRVALLQIEWPTSGTTQVFHDIDINQSIEVTEFATNYQTLKSKPISLPK